MKKFKLTLLFSIPAILLLIWALLYEIPTEINKQNSETSKHFTLDSANIITNVVMNNAGPNQIDIKSLEKFILEHKSREIEPQYDEHIIPGSFPRVVAYDKEGEKIYDSHPSNEKTRKFRWKDIEIKNKNGKFVGTISISKLRSDIDPIFNKTKEKIQLISIIVFVAILMVVSLLLITLYKEIKQYERKTLIERIENERLNERVKTESKGREDIEEYINSIKHEITTLMLTASLSIQKINKLKIKNKDLTESIKSIKEDIHEAAELVRRLVQLATFEKKVRLENIEQVNIRSLIDEYLNDQYIEELSKSKNIKIKNEINPKLDIYCEKLLAKRALVNILNNSLDFSPRGSIITIKVNESTTHTNILISDQGVGIPLEAKHKIFTKLCYSTERPDTGKKSTGLGLRFVKQVMSLHGGRVSLDNNPAGVGAVATLSFPIK